MDIFHHSGSRQTRFRGYFSSISDPEDSLLAQILHPDRDVIAAVKEVVGMRSWDSVMLWIKRLCLGVYWSESPGSDWPKGQTCSAYTDQRVEEMIKRGDLIVTGESGLCRDEPVIIRGVPGMLAGREIAVILSQKMVDHPTSEWRSKKVEYFPNQEDDPLHFIYKVLAGLPDGSVKEVWFDIYHRPPTLTEKNPSRGT